jgi:hypothetical protein
MHKPRPLSQVRKGEIVQSMMTGGPVTVLTIKPDKEYPHLCRVLYKDGGGRKGFVLLNPADEV